MMNMISPPAIHRKRKQEGSCHRDRLLQIAQRPDLSPLRYPGGKRKLVPLIADVFLQAGAPIKLLVEPFAGGAAVALALLEAGLAENIALADRDELVAAFWKTIFSPAAEALADRVRSASVTLTEWDRLRATEPGDDLERAYKCLFLNRTSFSGILHRKVGVIGGRGQSGRYAIGCRFNQSRLADRILELSRLRDRVRFVRCQSYRKTIADVRATQIARDHPDLLFWYLDPPFFEKAEWLYRYAFDAHAHKQFKQDLLKHLPGHWILSYDDAPQAREYYSQHPGFSRVNLSYNARVDAGDRLLSSEIIVSNIIARLRAQHQVLWQEQDRPMLVQEMEILQLLNVPKENTASVTTVAY